MKNAFDVVKDFEQALCEYTSAPYAVTTNSCTKALGLCFEWMKWSKPEVLEIEMPKHTYVGVAMQAKRAGYKIKFKNYDWEGSYCIDPLNVWDAARSFHNNMYDTVGFQNKSTFVCLSFHYTKILNGTQGGAILHNNEIFDAWARQMRFDGRQERSAGTDTNQFNFAGDHCYMGPETAALLLRKLNSIPTWNDDLPTDNYPDLSKVELFK